MRLASTDEALTRMKVLASTIDSVQGREFDAVILLTSRPSCVDLGRCRRRGNVATSRARDLLVIIGHQDYMVSQHKHSPRPYRFWGQLIAEATLWDDGDHVARGLLITLKAKISLIHRRRNGTKSSSQTTDKQLIALAALEEVDKYHCLQSRASLFKVLLLRDKFQHNNALQFNLFVCAMNIKSDELFRQTLTIISQAIDHRVRNTQLCALFKIHYKARGPNQHTKDRISKLYERT